MTSQESRTAAAAPLLASSASSASPVPSLIRARIGVLAIATLNMAGLFIAPVMGMIVGAFRGEQLSNVQLILSISNLTGLIAAFVIGRLAMTRITNKAIALGGIAFIAIFGLVPYWVHANVWILVTCAGLLGIGMGTLSNILPALMADYFSPQERQGMMGLQVAVASVGMLVFSLVAGKLGTISWNSAYLVYAAAILVFLAVWFILPRVEKQIQKEGQHNAQGALKDVLSPTVLALCVFGMLFLLLNNAYHTNYALIVEQNGLGGSDISGVISTVGQAGGLLAGLGVGLVAKSGRDYMLALTFALLAAGMAVCALVPTVWGQALGAFVVNASMSFFFASAPFMMTVLVKPWLIPLGMAVLTVFNSLGGFISPYVINFVNSFFGSRAVGAVSVGAVAAVVVCGVLLLTQFQKKGFAQAFGQSEKE